MRTVDETHLKRCGQPATDRVHLVRRALAAMKKSRLAKNPRRGFWHIFSTGNTVEEIIRVIEIKSTSGGYIYRGERKCYPKISSGLYRELGIESERLSEHFNIEVAQREMLTFAKKHTGDLPQGFRVDFAPFLNTAGKDTEAAVDFEILTALLTPKIK